MQSPLSPATNMGPYMTIKIHFKIHFRVFFPKTLHSNTYPSQQELSGTANITNAVDRFKRNLGSHVRERIKRMAWRCAYNFNMIHFQVRLTWFVTWKISSVFKKVRALWVNTMTDSIRLELKELCEVSPGQGEHSTWKLKPLTPGVLRIQAQLSARRFLTAPTSFHLSNSNNSD